MSSSRSAPRTACLSSDGPWSRSLSLKGGRERGRESQNARGRGRGSTRGRGRGKGSGSGSGGGRGRQGEGRREGEKDRKAGKASEMLQNNRGQKALDQTAGSVRVF
eukprot:3077566-Rhodomonas_salina.3